MCGRYYIGLDSEEEWLAILEALNRKGAPEGMKTSGEIFPSDIVPVLANNRQGERRPFAMRWGYSFPGGRPVINARAETAETKPLFRDGMRQRRCLVPASHYFEWERCGEARRKYALRPAHAGMFYLAGIYHWENHSGALYPTFALLTRQAAPDIAFIHDRMPVILPAERACGWLNPQNDAQDVLQSARNDMEYRPA